MNAPIKDGGPAFPVASYPDANGQICWGTDGMTLRDWFAGQALQAIAARNTDRTYLDDAEEAYSFADAMITAREVKP